MKAIISPAHALALFNFLYCYVKDGDNHILFAYSAGGEYLYVTDKKNTFQCCMPLLEAHPSESGSFLLLCEDIPKISLPAKSLMDGDVCLIEPERVSISSRSFVIKGMSPSAEAPLSPLPSLRMEDVEYLSTAYYAKGLADVLTKLPGDELYYNGSNLTCFSSTKHTRYYCPFLPFSKDLEEKESWTISLVSNQLYKKLVAYFDLVYPEQGKGESSLLLFAEPPEGFYFKLNLPGKKESTPRQDAYLSEVGRQKPLLSFEILDPIQAHADAKGVKSQIGKENDAVEFRVEGGKLHFVAYEEMEVTASVESSEVAGEEKYSVFLLFKDLLETLDCMKGKPKKKGDENYENSLRVGVYSNVIKLESKVMTTFLVPLRVA